MVILDSDPKYEQQTSAQHPFIQTTSESDPNYEESTPSPAPADSAKAPPVLELDPKGTPTPDNEKAAPTNSVPVDPKDTTTSEKRAIVEQILYGVDRQKI